MQIDLKRLKLIPSSLKLIETEINDFDTFLNLLSVETPDSWPPPLNDEHSQKWFLNYIKNNPDKPGWGMWYFILKNSASKDVLIGNGGFKGLPDDAGSVEIGYSVLERFQKRGFATEATAGLINWAFNHQHVKNIIAHTLVNLRASIRVLEKNNFKFAGNTDEEGVIRFELKKSEVSH